MQEQKKSTLKDKLKCNMKKIWDAFLNLIITILTLKNTGKWISVITISFVLGVFCKFLTVHSFSMAAMTLVIPYLGQIAIVVFGIIGGFKGVSSLVEKVQSSKALIDSTKAIFSGDEKKEEQIQTPPSIKEEMEMP